MMEPFKPFMYVGSPMGLVLGGGGESPIAATNTVSWVRHQQYP